MSDRALTPIQERFVKEYLIDLDGANAVRRAGYKVKLAKNHANELLREPHIKAAIEKEKKAREKRTKISADTVLAETAKLAFTDIRKLFNPDSFELIPPTELPDDVAPAVSSIKKKVTVTGTGEYRTETTTWEYIFWDKTKALEKLFRHLGMYDDKSTVDIGDKLASILQEIDGKGLPKPNAG